MADKKGREQLSFRREKRVEITVDSAQLLWGPGLHNLASPPSVF